MHCKIDGLAVEIDPAELSTGGLFVPTATPPAVDSEVLVSLSIGSLRVEATGHVVQSVGLKDAKRERGRLGFGLLFTQLDDRTRAELRDAIDGLNAPPEQTSTARGAAAAHSSSRPASDTPTIDPKEAELLARLTSELAALELQPPWTVLGISQGADAAAAREAFFTASKRYHPHVYARYALPEIKAVVTQLFITYKRAFTSMTKTSRPARGASVVRAAKSGNPPGRSSDPGTR